MVGWLEVWQNLEVERSKGSRRKRSRRSKGKGRLTGGPFSLLYYSTHCIINLCVDNELQGTDNCTSILMCIKGTDNELHRCLYPQLLVSRI